MITLRRGVGCHRQGMTISKIPLLLLILLCPLWGYETVEVVAPSGLTNVITKNLKPYKKGGISNKSKTVRTVRLEKFFVPGNETLILLKVSHRYKMWQEIRKIKFRAHHSRYQIIPLATKEIGYVLVNVNEEDFNKGVNIEIDEIVLYADN